MGVKKRVIIVVCVCSFIIGIIALIYFICTNNDISNSQNQTNTLGGQNNETKINENVNKNNETKPTENVDKNNEISSIGNVSQNNEIEQSEKVSDKIKIYDIEEGFLTVPANAKAIKHSYIWDNLSTNKKYYSYSDQSYETKFGIDVSEYQGDIDWKKVKDAGVEFAFIRLGYRGYAGSGKLVLDSKFLQNINQATQNGIDVGIYFFSQAITVAEAKEEANYVLKNIKDKNVTYPICFDLEKIKFDTARTDNLTTDEITNMSLAFCEEIENAGYTPMVYGNAKTFTTRMNIDKFNEYQKWYADYQVKPLYPYSFTFWQYSEKGSVNGISGNVDLNLQFVDKNS